MRFVQTAEEKKNCYCSTVCTNRRTEKDVLTTSTNRRQKNVLRFVEAVSSKKIQMLLQFLQTVMSITLRFLQTVEFSYTPMHLRFVQTVSSYEC